MEGRKIERTEGKGGKDVVVNLSVTAPPRGESQLKQALQIREEAVDCVYFRQINADLFVDSQEQTIQKDVVETVMFASACFVVVQICPSGVTR